MGKKKRKYQVRQPNKTKKKSWLTYLAYVFILFGIGALLYPIAANWLAERQRSQATTIYETETETLSQKEKETMRKTAQQYNQAIFREQNGEDTTEKENYSDILKNNSGVMGTLEIPALNINSLPFFHGTSYGVLDKGLGHFEPTSIPVGGENTRSVITGHSGMQNQVLFSDINRLKEGDIFFIHILGDTLAYEIRSFEEVLPEDSHKVGIIPGEDIVTLLTCTPPGINTYRLLVNGYRIPYEKAMNRPIERRNLWSYQRIVGIALVITIGMFCLLAIIYRKFDKLRQNSHPMVAEKAEKKLRSMILCIRSLFLFILASLLVLLGLAIYGYREIQQNRSMPEINIGMETNLSAYNKEKIIKANYDVTQIQSVGIKNYTESLSTYQDNVNEWGIGKLVIPTVSIDLPILAGLSNSNLLNGVATFEENQQMGEGNYVLMAHNLMGTDALLNNVAHLDQGDEIYLTDFNQVYQYKVTRNDVIEETEITVLDESNEKQVTLIRCEGGIGTIYRRVVQGKLWEVTPIEGADDLILSMLGLTRGKNSHGEIIEKPLLSHFEEFCFNLVATILANPVQTMIPLFFLLIFPIIVLGMLK